MLSVEYFFYELSFSRSLAAYLMLLIPRNILHRPFHFLFKGMLSHGAVVFAADPAGKFKTSIRMNEELDRPSKVFPGELDELIDLRMRFVEVKVPGHR